MNLTREQKEILLRLLNLANGAHALVDPNDVTFGHMTVQQMRGIDQNSLNEIARELAV